VYSTFNLHVQPHYQQPTSEIEKERILKEDPTTSHPLQIEKKGGGTCYTAAEITQKFSRLKEDFRHFKGTQDPLAPKQLKMQGPSTRDK
jgi:hypothetical protein